MPTLYAGLITGNHKLIHNLSSGETELYNLRNDPNERQDLSEQEKDLTRQLMALLQAVEPSASEARETQMDEKTLQRLRSLGYLQ